MSLDSERWETGRLYKGEEIMKELNFRLTKAARSSGGDRYECGQKGDEFWMVIYIPQSLSREDGKIKDTLTVTIK